VLRGFAQSAGEIADKQVWRWGGAPNTRLACPAATRARSTNAKADQQ
jgi:hypothetical protein